MKIDDGINPIVCWTFCTPEEIEAMNKMWLIDRVTSLGRENEEMKKAIQEMATRLKLQKKHAETMYGAPRGVGLCSDAGV